MMRRSTWAAIAALSVAACVSIAALSYAGVHAVAAFTAGAAAVDLDPDPKRVVLVGEGWTCTGSQALDLVKVTDPRGNAITLGAGCTGTIGRVEVEGVRNGDGIRITGGGGNPAHDLTIGGGYLSCPTGPTDGTHQDGIQAGSGRNITFRNLVIDCVGSGGGNLFVQKISSSAFTPTGVVCEHCAIGGRHVSTVELGASVSSGARDSLLCLPRSGRAAFIVEGATSPVNVGNTVAPRGDERCASLAALLAWAEDGTPPTEPPPPEPSPPVITCDQPCIIAYEQRISTLTDSLAAARAELGSITAAKDREIGRLNGLLDDIAVTVGRR